MIHKLKYSFFTLLCLILFAPKIWGQACAGATVTVNILNAERVSADEFTYEVWFFNSNSNISMNIANLQGGVIGLPAGIIGTFSVVELPTTIGLNGLTLTTPTVSSNILMRWTETALPSPGIPMSTSPTKFAKFRYIRSGGTALPSSFNLSWQASGGAALQVVGYCGGNSNSSAYATSAGNLIAGTATLPIELSSFTGKTLDHSNLLQWTTASERNVQWHNIERSADGITGWNLVGKVAGKGNSQSEQHYSLEDRAPLAQSYYRLRTVDFDGQEQISHVVVLTRKDSRFGILSAFPNPATESIAVEFNTDEESNVTILINDVTGRLIVQQEVGTTKGVNLLPIQLGQFSAGTYFITLQNGSSVTEPMRFVKQ